MARLSPTTRWYVCRLLQSHPELMGEDVQPGERRESGTLDVNQFLDQLLASDASIAAKIPEIERLAQIHQGLTTQGNHFLNDVNKMEAQVFMLLGLRRPDQNSQTPREKPGHELTGLEQSTEQSKVDQPPKSSSPELTQQPLTKVTRPSPEPSKLEGASVTTYLTILNQLSQLGKKYLGAHIIVNYWQTTRPAHAWLEDFRIQPTAELQWQGSTDVALNALQEQVLQQWIVEFINRCTQVVRNFAQLVEQTELLNQVLSQGRR
jgi:hypothetical protein